LLGWTQLTILGKTSVRIAISEWRWSPDVVRQYALARGISDADAERSFHQLGERVQKSLRLKTPPFEISLGGVLAKGVAGIVGLDGDFEIEIVPKYASATSPCWRQDLLFMTMLSKHGNLLLQNQIKAAPSGANDLASLISEVLLRLFYSNRRTPLKTYHFVQYHDFALEGEFDAEDLLMPDSEGFEQHRYQFDSNNEFSATVKAAVDVLTRKVRDPSLLSRLRHLSADIGTVSAKQSGVRRLLPARLRRWQTLYDLAFDVTRGFGLAPGGSHHEIPGFVVSTWQIWEDLIASALIQAFGSAAVRIQRGHSLGNSFRGGKNIPINVIPDNVLVEQTPPLIVDAKYKGRVEDGAEWIGNADFYEALAFMQGVSTNQAILVYPSTTDVPRTTGTTEVIEKAQLLNGNTVWAVALELNGISEVGGFLKFVDGLKSQIVTLTHSPIA
jgi:5-methylcytosine-specific restriction endonuclease McrBC regulatory subunit McrC